MVAVVSVHESQVKESNFEDTFFVERRYCIACNIEQPIRSKHCKSCNKCVARFDHHCPWIGKDFLYLIHYNSISKGKCIGEKNHQLFFWFLVFQFGELGWAGVQVNDFCF